MLSNFSKGTWIISAIYRIVLLDLLKPNCAGVNLYMHTFFTFNVGFGGTSLLL